MSDRETITIPYVGGSKDGQFYTTWADDTSRPDISHPIEDMESKKDHLGFNHLVQDNYIYVPAKNSYLWVGTWYTRIKFHDDVTKTPIIHRDMIAGP